MSDAHDPDVTLIAKTLRSIEPRAAQALILRLVEGLSRDRCAAAYGIGLDAFDVKLWRALRAFRQQSPLDPFDQERAWAQKLSRALDPPSSPLDDPQVLAAWELARSIEKSAPRIKDALDTLSREEEASPARSREDWIRRAIIVAIILVTALFERETLETWIRGFAHRF